MEEFGQMQAFSATHLSRAAWRRILNLVAARASYAQTTAGWKSSLYGASRIVASVVRVILC